MKQTNIFQRILFDFVCLVGAILLLDVFYAWGGIRTGNKLPGLTAYTLPCWLMASWGKGGFFVAPPLEDCLTGLPALLSELEQVIPNYQFTAYRQQCGRLPGIDLIQPFYHPKITTWQADIQKSLQGCRMNFLYFASSNSTHDFTIGNIWYDKQFSKPSCRRAHQPSKAIFQWWCPKQSTLSQDAISQHGKVDGSNLVRQLQSYSMAFLNVYIIIQ